MSPTGSELGISSILYCLPGSLPNPGNLRLVRQHAEAQAADLELAMIAAAAPADRAAVVAPRRELGLLLLLDLPTDTRHGVLLLWLTEGNPEPLQQFEGITRPARLDADRDVHALRELQLLDVDLGEHDLLRDAQVVVPRLVERPGRQPAEVADAGNHDRDQPVQEFVHPGAAQRHLQADVLALAELEVRDRLPRLRDHRLLAADHR